ncbi:hypothetical protein [Croceibacter atlanticus]|uniref:hypothetical protein n=1 Tax=Croceibacter atlanticus TaxID=313588 RepID=UPI0030DB79E5|tara:strand:- start:127445 stop:128041 length:597 start_codon:yes stop_codon:yes gene_type:complete
MKKNLLVLSIIVLSSVLTSCKKNISTIVEADYKVVEVDYGFNNYMRNIRDQSNMLTIKERNIVIINVDKNGLTKIENNFIEDSLIVAELKRYITPNPENEKMPITIKKEFKYSGNVLVNKNTIFLAQYSKALDYKTYSTIRNKIYLAFNEVRNEFSIERFDKTLLELITSNKEDDMLKRYELKQIFPMHYNEVIIENK